MNRGYLNENNGIVFFCFFLLKDILYLRNTYTCPVVNDPYFPNSPFSNIALFLRYLVPKHNKSTWKCVHV